MDGKEYSKKRSDVIQLVIVYRMYVRCNVFVTKLYLSQKLGYNFLDELNAKRNISKPASNL